MMSAGKVIRLPTENPRRAGGQQRAGVRGLRHDDQRRRLSTQGKGTGQALVRPIGDRAEHQAPHDRHGRGDRHSDAGGVASDRRLQERDQVHEKAGL